MPGLDPFKLSEIVERQVVRMNSGRYERRYYRFRGGRWYGGISTGDVVGCNLRCKFCWSWRYSFYSDKGWFESPVSAFKKLVDIATKCRYRYLRLSGGEPTIGVNHLIELLRLVEDTRYVFILETNGLLLGRYMEYAKTLSGFHRLIIRVSFKGCNEKEFEVLSGADRVFYEYQLKALENLSMLGFKPCEEFYPAVMLSFSSDESYNSFKRMLSKVHAALSECIDEEYIILYPHVKELLKKNKLTPRIAYDPSGIPESMI
ncbi:MAG: radical SAM protein [Desulfurococcaceae archaeon]